MLYVSIYCDISSYADFSEQVLYMLIFPSVIHLALKLHELVLNALSRALVIYLSLITILLAWTTCWYEQT